ncbi:hypothetical protein OFO03_00340 [Campylobacter sp. JMF_02 ED1]|nr:MULTISPECIES: hypothetical protein [unclassified Campylobacter]MDA3048931.1 hypothetical protein [Campylobacter sp. JMF_15 NE4]MDA3050358.1 hypothetical protein [Campylobacter sp. JMF_02 ED1]
MGKMTTASDVMKNVSNGASVGDAVKNLNFTGLLRRFAPRNDSKFANLEF